MNARSLVVTMVTAAILLTGCATTGEHYYVSPAKRPQEHKKCDVDDCNVPVDPTQWVWLPENIDVKKGNHVVFQLPRYWNWSDPPIKLKDEANARYFSCQKLGNGDVKCKVANDANVDKIGYTLRVQLTFDYDPFIWPN